MSLRNCKEIKFAYLLYPIKSDTSNHKLKFDNDVDKIYYYFNWGIPEQDLIDPVIVDQTTVDSYGLENLVVNLQQKYKYDFDIVVVKVPEEYMNMQKWYIHEPIYSDEDVRYLRSYQLPMVYAHYDQNLQEKISLLSAVHIESYYLRFPDCRRVVNDHWKIINSNHQGMIAAKPQIDAIDTIDYVNRDYVNAITKYRKANLFGPNSVIEKSVADYMQSIFGKDVVSNDSSHDFKEKIVANPDENKKYYIDDFYTNFIEKKYGSTDHKPYNCSMSKERIRNILMVEEKRREKLQRHQILGD